MPNHSELNGEPTANGSANQAEPFAEQGRTKGEPFGEPDAGQWRTVQEIAELEGLSERAIQKRCQRGHYVARRVEGDKGDVWEIDAASIGAPKARSANAEPTANGSPNNAEPTANGSPNKGERFAEPSPNGGAESDHATAREVEALRAQLENSRAEIEREREISAFLKLQIEEGNRNAAELRAALREALRAMPKQLEAGTPQVPDAIPDQANSSSRVADGIGERRYLTPRPLWKVMIGLR